MLSYLQLAGDPTKWWLSPRLEEAGDLTDLPLSVQVVAPLAGTLLISPKVATITLTRLDVVDSVPDPGITIQESIIYLPTTTGPSADAPGHVLPAATNLDDLTREIKALMRDGGRKVLTASSLPGLDTLVLNGHTLPFVVLCGATTASGDPQSPPQ